MSEQREPVFTERGEDILRRSDARAFGEEAAKRGDKQPTSMLETEAEMHKIIVMKRSMPMHHRVRSYRWLTERKIEFTAPDIVAKVAANSPPTGATHNVEQVP